MTAYEHGPDPYIDDGSDAPAVEMGRRSSNGSNGATIKRVAAEDWLVDYAIEIERESKLERITTGFPSLDRLLGGGLGAHTLTVMAGPEGGGKTAFAAQLATLHAAQGRPVLYYSGELTRAQLTARIAGQLLGLGWGKVLHLEDITLEEVREALDGIRLRIRNPSANPLKMIEDALVELVELDAGTVLLVIDYMQLLTDMGKDARTETALVVRSVQRMTERLPIVTFALAQGSKASSQQMRKGDGEVSDFAGVAAETAEFQRGARNCLALVGARPEGVSEWDLAVYVTKASFGMPGRIGIHFNGRTGNITELDEAPAKPSDTERENEILRIVNGHDELCPECDGKPLSANAFKDSKRHKVTGNTDQIKKAIDRLARKGLIRNEGGVILKAAQMPLPTGPPSIPRGA